MKIILASGSPRRAKILKDLGVEFEIVKSDAEEVAYPHDPERTVRENAIAKGQAAREVTRHTDGGVAAREVTRHTDGGAAAREVTRHTDGGVAAREVTRHTDGGVAAREGARHTVSRATREGSELPVLSADTIVWFNNKIYGKPRDLEEAKEYLRTLSGRTHTVFTGVAFSRTASALASHVEVKVVRSDVKFRELSDAMIDEYVARVKPTDRAGAYDIDESGDLIVESYTGSYENIMGLPVEPLRDWGILCTVGS